MKPHHAIARWRKAMGLTQAQFGEQIVGRKRSQRTIAGWESGEAKIPLDIVLETLGVDEETFLEGPKGNVDFPEPAKPNLNIEEFINVSSLIPLYMLSEIKQSWEATPIEGFTESGTILPNKNDFCIVRVDQKTKNVEHGQRLLVNKVREPVDGDLILVWDKNSRKAGIEEFRLKLRSSWVLLGVVL